MKKILMALFVMASMLFIAGPAVAEKPVTPVSLEGVTVVGDEWVKANHGKMKIFDVRKKAEYVESHIPGAISAPYKEKSKKVPDFDASMDKLDLSKFPADKNATFIVHCNGMRCWKSYKASTQLVKAGYKNVKWYRHGGFPGWVAKGYPVE